jgi:phosphate:Na+ symporter
VGHAHRAHRILRLYGGDLRRILRRSVARNRLAAFMAGIGVTGLIQSSTATALIVAAFAGQGIITTRARWPSCSAPTSAPRSSPSSCRSTCRGSRRCCIFAGVVLFLARQATRVGRFGRILIGLGLILFALQWIRVAAQPIVGAAGVKVLFASLTGDVMLDVLVAAMFTILCYSSLAVVLLVAALAQLGVIAPPVALGLVLGANLGSGTLGMLSTLRSPPEARRVTLGNFLFKLIGVVIAIPLVNPLLRLVESMALDAGQEVVAFHLLFQPRHRAHVHLLHRPDRVRRRAAAADAPDPDDPAKPRHLDPSALDTPPLAISNAAREAIRIGDTVEHMLTGMLTVLKTNDRTLARQLRDMDDTVDSLYTAVKLYLTQISREALDEREGRRWADIVSFTINLEQVGDIIERILSDIEDKKIDKGRNFSEAGMAEICDLHARLVANLRLGMSVFLNGDLKSAQELLAQKVLFRDLERAYADSHLARLAGNTVESIETSSLHLDLISDMKRINSHVCSIAYPILEQAACSRTRGSRAPRPRASRRGRRPRPALVEGQADVA